MRAFGPGPPYQDTWGCVVHNHSEWLHHACTVGMCPVQWVLGAQHCRLSSLDLLTRISGGVSCTTTSVTAPCAYHFGLDVTQGYAAVSRWFSSSRQTGQAGSSGAHRPVVLLFGCSPIVHQCMPLEGVNVTHAPTEIICENVKHCC